MVLVQHKKRCTMYIRMTTNIHVFGSINELNIKCVLPSHSVASYTFIMIFRHRSQSELISFTIIIFMLFLRANDMIVGIILLTLVLFNFRLSSLLYALIIMVLVMMLNMTGMQIIN